MNKTKKWEGVVAKAVLPVRKNPNSKAGEHSFSPIYKDDHVYVCDTRKGWYYIEAGGKYGYVSSKWVKFSASIRGAKPSKTIKWIGKTNQKVSIRSKASSKASVVMSLQQGSVIYICDTIDGWWYVKYKNKYGFILARYVTYLAVPDGNAKAMAFLAAVKETQEYARKHNYIYGDSQSSIPTADGKISCDRLAAKALYDMGYTDQVKGGIALGRGIEEWLLKHKFKKSTSMTAAKPGSILIVMNPSGSSRHVFVIASKNNGKYTRYDCGSLNWIRSKQPLPGLWMSRLIAVYNL